MIEGLKFDARQMAKRGIIAGGLDIASVFRALGIGKALAGRGVIFTLHHVRQPRRHIAEPNAHLEVSPEFLDAALGTIIEAGYEPVALPGLVQRLKAGNPEKPVAVFTLDDGYRNNAEIAAPIFKKHGVPFTIFVTRGLSERTHTLWWETLAMLVNATDAFPLDTATGRATIRCRNRFEKIAAYEKVGGQIIGPDEAGAIERLNEAALAHGIDPQEIVRSLVMDRHELKALYAEPLAHLGAHTISHRALSYLSSHEAADEMTASAIYVSELTGRKTSVFSYPYGFAAAVSDRDKALAMDCGFELAVTTAPGTLTAQALANPCNLPRVSLNGLYQKTRHVLALASGIPFKLMR